MSTSSNTEKLEGGGTDGVYYAGDTKVIDVVAGSTIRQSPLCCGFCCDVRRATIIVNIIFACFASMGFLMYVLSFGVLSNIDFEDLDDGYNFDDQFQANAEQASTLIVIGIIMSVANVIFSGVGIYGAMKYNQCMVICTGVWYCVVALVDLITMNWTGAIMAAFFAYPHIVLFQEMKKGVITPDNYIYEKYSCCCV